MNSQHLFKKFLTFKMIAHNNNTAIELHEVSTSIIFQSSLPIILIGIIGNILNIIVFTRPKFRETQAGFYLSCLAFSDILQTYLVIGFFLQSFGIIVDNTSSFACKMNNYLYSTVPILSAWLIKYYYAWRFSRDVLQ